MNMQRIVEAVLRGEIPEGYTRRDLGDGVFVFERTEQGRESHNQTLGEILSQHLQTNAGENIAKQREQDGLDAFRQSIRAMIERRTGVDFSNLAPDAQAQHDHVLEQQRQQMAMFERTLKQKTFDLGNATMCDLPKSVLKVLKMLLNDAGEAAVHNDEREFDTQIDAFNGLMLASGVKINCL